MTLTDNYWKIHTESNNTITATYAQNSPDAFNNLSRGETASFEFLFTTENLVVESGETYTIESGTTEVFQTVNIKQNGTLNIEQDGQLIETGDNISELQKYDDHAGSVVTNETLNNTITFRNQLPNTDIDSLAIGIEPSESLQNRNVLGVWGVIQNIGDLRPTTLNQQQLQIDVVILDRYSAYTDNSDLNNALEV
jgi:hypothetical protein